VKRPLDVHPVRLTAPALACALVLGGCSSIENWVSGDKVDYRNSASSLKPLEVPPDLSQLARDSRYQPQGGAISASNVAPGAAGTSATATSAPVQGSAAVAPLALGDIGVQRSGSERWLSLPLPPEQVWPQVKAFWTDSGFKLASENAEAGTMETDWAENRAKIPTDFIRSSIGKVFDSLYQSSERDKFRTRVERRPDGGSEIYISHRGMEEVYSGQAKDVASWRLRASDPQLEAEQLSLLMVKLASKATTQAQASASAPASAQPIDKARALVAAAPEQAPRARPVTGGTAAALEMDDPFDRAWRRVGLALDRSGFTVEDRDRASGLYFVRYIDPKSAGAEDPGLFGKWFGGTPTASSAAVRYRIQVKGQDQKTVVSVLSSAGAPESGENAQRMIGLLVNELK